MKQWLNVKDDVEGKEGNKRYTLSKVLCFACCVACLQCSCSDLGCNGLNIVAVKEHSPRTFSRRLGTTGCI